MSSQQLTENNPGLPHVAFAKSTPYATPGHPPFPPPKDTYPRAVPIIPPTPKPPPNGDPGSYPGPPQPDHHRSLIEKLFHHIRKWLMKPVNSGIVLISLILLLFLM